VNKKKCETTLVVPLSENNQVRLYCHHRPEKITFQIPRLAKLNDKFLGKLRLLASPVTLSIAHQAYQARQMLQTINKTKAATRKISIEFRSFESGDFTAICWKPEPTPKSSPHPTKHRPEK
jgi:hypothetical protein